MIRHFTWLLFAVLLVSAILTGCKEKNKGDSGDALAADTSSVALAYWRLEGSMGDKEVVMHLVRSLSAAADGQAYYNGFYYYQDEQSPVRFYGSTDSTGRIGLTEETSPDVTPATFSGTWADDGRFEGTWNDGQDKDVRQFRLTESYPEGSTAFDIRFMADSLALEPGKPGSPRAFKSISWLRPKQVEERAAMAFLEEELRRGVLGDSLAGVYKDLGHGFAATRDTFFNQYRSDAEAFASDSLAMETFNYEQNTSVDIYYNENNLLTLGFTEYAYLGGAHGMHATRVCSYDMKNRRRLEVEDVFRPGFEKALAKALEAAARRKFRLEAGQSLDEALLVEEVQPNGNFGLTGKGVFFNYAPYEIAAYAVGEIELFIPFNEIRDWLQPALTDSVQ